jgi:hypothetical protein
MPDRGWLLRTLWPLIAIAIVVVGLAAVTLIVGLGRGYVAFTAPPPGTFIAVADMTVPRSEATATLLQDGRVLIVGGLGDRGYLASAELFDPRSRAFQAAASLPTPLGGHTATLLPGGRVLIAGGFDANTQQRTRSALLYDSRTGVFTATGSLNEARSNHCAVLLSNGRVLIVGGYGVQSLAPAEIYDPATGAFSRTGSLSASIWQPAAVLLPDGDVLVVSAGYAALPGPAAAELYHPETGISSPTGSMVEGWATSAAVLRDGRVLVVGEEYDLPVGTLPVWSPVAEIYDPASGAFESIEPPAALGSLTPLPDGRVLLVGGGADGSFVQLFDPATESFRAAKATLVERYGPAVTTLRDGSVLLAGGSGPHPGDASGPVLDSAELYWP